MISAAKNTAVGSRIVISAFSDSSHHHSCEKSRPYLQPSMDTPLFHKIDLTYNHDIEFRAPAMASIATTCLWEVSNANLLSVEVILKDF